MRFKGMTATQHQQTGETMRAIHMSATDAFFRVQEAYPKSSKVGRAAYRALAGSPFGIFLNLKNELDNAFFRDCPETESPDSPYYGWDCPVSKHSPAEGIALCYLDVRKRKTGLTAKDHREVAGQLQAIKTGMEKLSKKIFRAYGASSRQGREIEKLSKSGGALYRLQAVLDEISQQEWRAGTNTEAVSYFKPCNGCAATDRVTGRS